MLIQIMYGHVAEIPLDDILKALNDYEDTLYKEEHVVSLSFRWDCITVKTGDGETYFVAFDIDEYLLGQDYKDPSFISAFKEDGIYTSVKRVKGSEIILIDDKEEECNNE